MKDWQNIWPVMRQKKTVSDNNKGLQYMESGKIKVTTGNGTKYHSGVVRPVQLVPVWKN